MEQNKFKLSSEVLAQLRYMRQYMNLAAEDVSVELGKSKAWLGQIERGKLLSIKKNDLIKLLEMYTVYSEEEIVSDGVLDNFIETGFALKNAPESKDWYEEVELIESYFYNYLNRCESDKDRNEKLIYIHALLRCLERYPESTSSFIQIFSTLEEIFDCYIDLTHDQYFLKALSLRQKLDHILKEELDTVLELVK